MKNSDYLALPLQTDQIVLVRYQFVLYHILLPFIFLAMVFWSLDFIGFDFKLAKQFFDPDLQAWPYKDHWLIQKVFHKGGRLFYIFLIACMLLSVVWVSTTSGQSFKAYRRALTYTLLASISGPLLIMFLKDNTHISCPWDLQIFGGRRLYLRWDDPVTPEMPIGHCFPAAHAASGFAFINWYYFFWVLRAEYRFYGLLFGLFLGSLYGLSQQMRGAHFISHDITSLAIAWFMATAWFLIIFWKQLRWI